MPQTLIVFARAPVAGRCKTRLIPRYGARGAARLHRQLVIKTLDTASACGATVQIWCEPDTNHGFFHDCRRRYGVTLKRQPRGDLGRKMSWALSRSIAAGASAVIAGTDCAALGVRDIAQAFARLDRDHDYVLQPAADGGYVLIGARVAAAGALRAVQWSSGRELAQTRTRLARLGLRWAELPALWDVDLPRDVKWARHLGLI